MSKSHVLLETPSIRWCCKVPPLVGSTVNFLRHRMDLLDLSDLEGSFCTTKASGKLSRSFWMVCSIIIISIISIIIIIIVIVNKIVIIEIILITLSQHLGQFGIRTTDFGSLKPNTSRKDGFGASPSMKTPMPIMNFIRPKQPFPNGHSMPVPNICGSLTQSHPSRKASTPCPRWSRTSRTPRTVRCSSFRSLVSRHLRRVKSVVISIPAWGHRSSLFKYHSFLASMILLFSSSCEASKKEAHRNFLGNLACGTWWTFTNPEEASNQFDAPICLVYVYQM